MKETNYNKHNDNSLKIAKLEVIVEEFNKNIQRIDKSINEGFKDLKCDINKVNVRLNLQENENEKKFVMRNEFDPVRKLVYSVIGLALSAVVAAVLSLVLNDS